MKKFTPDEQKKVDEFDSSMYEEPDTRGLKRKILDQAYLDGYVKEENLDRSNLYIDQSKNRQTGKVISTWDTLKSTTETAEEYRDSFLDYDLQDLKKEQVRKNNKNGKFYDGWGLEQKDANKNYKIRKQISRVLKKAGIQDPKEVDRVMFARNWESYKLKRDKQKKPFETTLDNVINQRTPGETGFDNINEIINSTRNFRHSILENNIGKISYIPAVPQFNQEAIQEPVFFPKEKSGIELLAEKPKEFLKKSIDLKYLLGVSDE